MLFTSEIYNWIKKKYLNSFISVTQAWDRGGGVTGQKNQQAERKLMNKRQAIMKSFIGKNSDSPLGFEPMTSCNQLDALTTELHRTPGELGHVSWSYSDMRPAYTARILSPRNVVKWPNSPGVIRRSVVRALDWYTAVHRFESCGDLRRFPHCPVLGTNWSKLYFCSPSFTFIIISFLMQVLC